MTLRCARQMQAQSDAWWDREEARWTREREAREVVATATQTPQVAEASSQGSSHGPEGGLGNLPACTWVPESGGNWHALNPSGAGGRYQIMPETWRSHGGQGEPQNAPPEEQTRVAERVYAEGGPKEWVNC